MKDITYAYLDIINKKTKLHDLRWGYISMILLPLISLILAFGFKVVNAILDVFELGPAIFEILAGVSAITFVLMRRPVKKDIKEAKKELKEAKEYLEKLKSLENNNQNYQKETIRETSNKKVEQPKKSKIYVNVDNISNNKNIINGNYGLKKDQIIQDDIKINNTGRYGLTKKDIIQDDLSVNPKIKKFNK